MDKIEYANNYTIGLGTGDVTITFLRQEEHIVELSMSYHLAKSLSKRAKCPRRSLKT